jgi:transcriptional regulator with XRE-family HTH domain
LQKAREKSGLSQEKLGFESGYHRTYISQLERGQKSPTLKALFKLAKALNLRPSALLQNIEDKKI